jgi:enterochelin esterase-like enzyme
VKNNLNNDPSLVRFTGAILMTIALVSGAGAQVRGGPGGARGGAGGGPRASSVEHVTVHGKSLEGNLEGDSPDRNVTVYLPPAYAGDAARRFPVIYFLHAFAAHSDNPVDQIKPSADRLASAQGFSEPIIVVPDAYTLHQGSMYSNSSTTGDWERFVAEDLVAYIDSHYRTLARPISRGLAGQFMGGYGALRIGMKRPDVFSSLYIMSACCLGMTDSAPETMLPTPSPQRAAIIAGENAALAAGAAWSPNPGNPPLFLDLPVQNRNDRPEIAAKWSANSPLSMLEQYASNLKKNYAISIEIDTHDALFLAKNRQLHEAMYRLKIPHFYEEYEGDAASKAAERFERNLLPFFSKSLASPANPTSPGVQ